MLPIRSSNKLRIWVFTCLLFALAVALRWIRLDLITFRFDQAAVAYRCMDTFRSGIPLTGITNSLGFENAGGYIWTILPSFVISPDPRVATAWHGLLSATMVIPLILLGRRYRSDAVSWLPAILAATLPTSVFAGRDLWAQNLLPVCSAWALLALDNALRESQPLKRRTIYAALCLTTMAWATSIHFSAGLLLVVAAGFVISALRNNLRSIGLAFLPAACVLLTLIPSALDWREKQLNPPEKPQFVLEYEQIIPDPLPWWARIQDSVDVLYSSNSSGAVPGIDENIKDPWRLGINAYDVLITTILLLSWIGAILSLLDRRRRAEMVPLKSPLLAWLLLPVLFGPLLVERINGSYFLGGNAALWLLVLFLPKVKWNFIATLLIGVVTIGGGMISGYFLTLIQTSGFINGPYYIPYGQQAKTVLYLHDQQVKPGQVRHLSGDWFQSSYDYIHRYVMPPLATSGNFAVMEDRKVRPDEPVRVQTFWDKAPVQFGDVGVILFDGRGQAEIFIQKYYDIGER